MSQQLKIKPEPHLSLFSARSGYLTAKLDYDDGTMYHIHSLVKPEAEGRFFTNLEFWGDLIVFLGTGLGYHIASNVGKIPFGSSIVLVDYYPELVGRCAWTCFNGRKIDAIVSSKTENLQGLLSSVSSEWRSIQFIKHPSSYRIHNSFYDSIADMFCKAAPTFAKAKSTVSDSVMILYGKFFLQDEMRAAVEQCGLKPVLYRYEELQNTLSYESSLTRHIQENRPEFILSINMKGFDANGVLSEIASRFDIPVVVWFVDDPHPILLHQARFIRPGMTALCWERTYIPWLTKQGFNRVGYLPLATDPNRFVPARNDTLAKLGFVGSSMGTHFINEIKKKFLWRDTLTTVMDNAAKVLLNDLSRNVFDIIKENCRILDCQLPFGDQRNLTWLCSCVIHTAGMLRRKETIGSLIPLGIETFGDPEGWRELLGDSLQTHPNIDYRTELNSIYGKILINVNITSCQMATAVNQRVFDIPASGGFLITDNQKDLSELFDKSEFVAYEDIDDLREKVRFYELNPGARDSITQKARSRILNEHTYLNRLKIIAKLLDN